MPGVGACPSSYSRMTLLPGVCGGGLGGYGGEDQRGPRLRGWRSGQDPVRGVDCAGHYGVVLPFVGCATLVDQPSGVAQRSL